MKKLLLHLSLTTLPLVAFTAILLALVYLNPFQGSTTSGDLTLDTSFTSDILYVNYSATRLILVASWSSSMALPIIGSLLTFASYTVAADMISSSHHGHHVLLPTPAQLAMLTDLLDAKHMAILTWLSSFWRKDERKVPSRWIIEFPAIVQLAALSLSVAIIAADTWLHVATKSVTKSYLYSFSDPSSLGMGYFYSRALSTECTDTTDICTVHQGTSIDLPSVAFPSDILSLAIGSSSYPTRINMTDQNSRFLAPELPQRTELVTMNGLFDQTFTATSFQINTTCQAITTDCQQTSIDSNATAWDFACPEGVAGQLNQSRPVVIDSWYRGNGTYANMSQYYEYNSNIEFGVFLLLTDTIVTPTNTSIKLNSKNNNTVVGAKCESTLTSVQYDWTNETAAATMQSFDDGPSSPELASLARAPLLAGYFDNSPLTTGSAPNNSFMTGFTRFQGSKPVEEAAVLEQMASTISVYGISLLGGALSQDPAVKLSLPDSLIVTEVGKAPLFTLVILNLWYACFGILLFALAMVFLRDPNNSKDIQQVQELISVHGLATAAVKRHRKHLDSADLRVGVEKVDDVWQFRVFEVSSVSSEAKPLLDKDDEDGEIA